MLSDSQKAINILEDITGKNVLSEDYIDLLKSHNISEQTGYIIKFKLYNEILAGKVNSKNVVSRLNLLIGKLSKSHSNNIATLNYDMDMLLFLNNQHDYKIKCENCGYMVLPIDQYCCKCGKKLVPTISLFELFSGINSQYIKPGDILKFNVDYTVEKTTNSEFVNSNVEELEQLYEEKIEKEELNTHYYKILLLDYISKNDLEKIDKLNKEYEITNFNEVLDELLSDNLIQNIANNNLISKFRGMVSKNKNDISTMYTLTQRGSDCLKENKHVLLYDFYVKNSLIDDITVYDSFLSKNDDSLENNFIKYIIYKRNLFKKNNDIRSFLSSYDLEAYFYETKSYTQKQLLALFKKFISSINIDYSKLNHLAALDKSNVSYLNNLIKNERINLSLMKKLFYNAFDEIDYDLIFTKEESFNYLLRAINGEAVNSINFDLELAINKKLNLES